MKVIIHFKIVQLYFLTEMEHSDGTTAISGIPNMMNKEN